MLPVSVLFVKGGTWTLWDFRWCIGSAIEWPLYHSLICCLDEMIVCGTCFRADNDRDIGSGACVLITFGNLRSMLSSSCPNLLSLIDRSVATERAKLIWSLYVNALPIEVNKAYVIFYIVSSSVLISPESVVITLGKHWWSLWDQCDSVWNRHIYVSLFQAFVDLLLVYSKLL